EAATRPNMAIVDRQPVSEVQDALRLLVRLDDPALAVDEHHPRRDLVKPGVDQLEAQASRAAEWGHQPLKRVHVAGKGTRVADSAVEAEDQHVRRALVQLAAEKVATAARADEI